MIRVELPYHLRTLASVDIEVEVPVIGQATMRNVIDALENEYPMLRGTIRDQVTGMRRPYLRIFASGRDLSHESPDTTLPEAVSQGHAALIILGAVAGG